MTWLHPRTNLRGNLYCYLKMSVWGWVEEQREEGVPYWQRVFSNNRLNPLLNQTLILWQLSRPNSCRFRLESELKKESRPGLLRDLKGSSKDTLNACSFVREAAPWKNVLGKKEVHGCVWIGLWLFTAAAGRLRKCTTECKILFYAPWVMEQAWQLKGVSDSAKASNQRTKCIAPYWTK